MLDAHKTAKVKYAENICHRDKLDGRQALKTAWHAAGPNAAWADLELSAAKCRRPKPRPLLRASSKQTRDLYNPLSAQLRRADAVSAVPAAPSALAIPAGMGSVAASGTGLISTSEGGFAPQHHGAVPQLPGHNDCPGSLAPSRMVPIAFLAKPKQVRVKSFARCCVILSSTRNPMRNVAAGICTRRLSTFSKSTATERSASVEALAIVGIETLASSGYLLKGMSVHGRCCTVRYERKIVSMRAIPHVPVAGGCP